MSVANKREWNYKRVKDNYTQMRYTAPEERRAARKKKTKFHLRKAYEALGFGKLSFGILNRLLRKFQVSREIAVCATGRQLLGVSGFTQLCGIKHIFRILSRKI